MIRITPVMRSLPFTLAVLLAVAVAVGAVVRRPAVSAEAAEPTFRVATFNIHKGADDANHYDLQRTIEAIAAFDADLVGLQEVLRNHAQFNCDDQPALITEGLRRLTGREWSYVYVKSWITENRECLQRRHGDDVETEGVAFFAPQRFLSTEQIRLTESRVGIAVRVASMPDVPVVVTHLAASRRNQEQRVAQIGELLPWAEKVGAGILVGDLNARPESSELVPLLARYRDSWLEGTERGTASGFTGGSTRPGIQSRIDYVLYDPTGPLTLESIEIRETATADLPEVSDHRPVIATFRRSPSRARATQ
jgi:endonuclease/exonuclease/phosphatase family metal-dependent hydrolase